MKEPNYITRPKFLAELKQLFEKYNIIITGCGCLDSPFLTAPSEDETVDSLIEHLAVNDLRLDDPHAT